jgi:hypothetical protein
LAGARLVTVHVLLGIGLGPGIGTLKLPLQSREATVEREASLTVPESLHSP